MNHRTVLLLTSVSSVTLSAVSSGAGVLGKPFETQQPASFLKNEACQSQSTHKAESFLCQELVLVWREQAQSLRQERWSQASVTGFPATWTLRNEVVESELGLTY